ncbi:MAG: protein kinase [Candidatus Woesearchaeota archaeon]|nr:protein kinase [Candidatus Woesearchaeota archaeon]
MVNAVVKVKTDLLSHPDYNKLPVAGGNKIILPAPEAHSAMCTTPEFEAWKISNIFGEETGPEKIFNARVTLETALADCGSIRRGEEVIVKRPENNLDGSIDTAGLDEEAQFLKKCQMQGVVELRNYVPSRMLMLRPVTTAQGTQPFVDWMKEQPYRRENHLDQTVLDALLQIVDTTQRIHAQGVVHRDLKPENIVVGDKTGVLNYVIVDFGNACYADSVPSERKFSKGSLTSMPPEQFTKASAQKASDVYALGVLIYRALTGMTPRDIAELECYAEKQEGVFPEVRMPLRMLNKYVSKNLAKLVGECLDADCAKRPSLEKVYGTLSEEKRHAENINSTGARGYIARVLAKVA